MLMELKIRWLCSVAKDDLRVAGSSVGWSSMTGSDSSLSDRAATNLLTRNASRPMWVRMRLYSSQVGTLLFRVGRGD